MLVVCCVFRKVTVSSYAIIFRTTFILFFNIANITKYKPVLVTMNKRNKQFDLTFNKSSCIYEYNLHKSKYKKARQCKHYDYKMEKNNKFLAPSYASSFYARNSVKQFQV